jgi:hypothetical protein
MSATRRLALIGVWVEPGIRQRLFESGFGREPATIQGNVGVPGYLREREI